MTTGYNNKSQNLDLPEDISAGAIIYNRTTKCFLLGEQNNKFWGFPKGHIENKETPVETMKRSI